MIWRGSRVAPHPPQEGKSVWELAAEGALSEADVDERGVLLSARDRNHPCRRSEGRDLCVVCWTEQRTHAIVPCFHMCSCVRCGTRLDSCPICRLAKLDLQRIYVP